MYDANWKDYVQMVRRQLGVIDFGDLVYVRSEYYVADQRRHNPTYEPPVAPLFGPEGRQNRQGQPGRAIRCSCSPPCSVNSATPKFAPQATRGCRGQVAALGQKIKDLEARIKLVGG